MSANTFIKSDVSDTLEVLSVKGQQQAFPEHFHETYCISLITQGIECIRIGGQNIYSPMNHISITNPFEVHANPLLDSDISLHFHTLYISPSEMDDYSRIRQIRFQNTPIADHKLNTAFLDVLQVLQNRNHKSTSNIVQSFIGLLVPYRIKDTDKNSFVFNNSWEEVFQFIDINFKNTIKIADLANIVNMNKYNFAKKFKQASGMSPINYIIMKRIFSAKKQITPGTNLTALAYDYNFTDISHFSRHFKSFIGLSPKQYQKGRL